jgi:hypothetical protein
LPNLAEEKAKFLPKGSAKKLAIEAAKEAGSLLWDCVKHGVPSPVKLATLAWRAVNTYRLKRQEALAELATLRLKGRERWATSILTVVRGQTYDVSGNDQAKEHINEFLGDELVEMSKQEERALEALIGELQAFEDASLRQAESLEATADGMVESDRRREVESLNVLQQAGQTKLLELARDMPEAGSVEATVQSDAGLTTGAITDADHDRLARMTETRRDVGVATQRTSVASVPHAKEPPLTRENLLFATNAVGETHYALQGRGGDAEDRAFRMCAERLGQELYTQLRTTFAACPLPDTSEASLKRVEDTMNAVLHQHLQGLTHSFDAFVVEKILANDDIRDCVPALRQRCEIAAGLAPALREDGAECSFTGLSVHMAGCGVDVMQSMMPGKMSVVAQKAAGDAVRRATLYTGQLMKSLREEHLATYA